MAVYRWAPLALALCAGCAPVVPTAQPIGDSLGLSALPKVGQVDARYQSYNVEMVEVTGGRFWAPYGGPADEVYRMRPPFDLANDKLIALTKQLGPSYMRVSGTWANSTYLPDEGENVSEPPEGYKQILTRDQWRGALKFAKAVDAEIVTSFAVSPGTRDANGVWQTQQADRMIELTKSEGMEIYGAEFYNEPNASFMGGLPDGYSASDYIRDFRIFKSWAAGAAPDMKLMGPSSVGEGALANIPVNGMPKGLILSNDTMSANASTLDIVTYHFYGGVSQRCDGLTAAGTAKLSDALTPAWLDKTLGDYNYYSGLRDKYESGDPIWITETAQAACGGSDWASSFVDSFRYLNQLGLLAQKNVQVIMHNTLAASDYSLIDEATMEPRPNYWAAILWKRTMGQTVLATPVPPSEDVRIYAHCLPESKGGVGLTMLNIGKLSVSLPLGNQAQAWVMSSDTLTSKIVSINGRIPALAADGSLSGLQGAPVNGNLELDGESIAFAKLPNAGNPACQ